jgi:hypothetical protein
MRGRAMRGRIYGAMEIYRIINMEKQVMKNIIYGSWIINMEIQESDQELYSNNKKFIMIISL